MKKNILVTGGSGFIGSAIVKYLVRNKHNVIVLDNNSRGRSRRIEEVKNEIKFIKGDIRNKKKLLSIHNKIDTVIHLAYVNGTKHFYKKPYEILDIAVDLRRDSPTYMQHKFFTLSEENFKQVYIPIGFAHGFLTLEDNCQVLYKVSNFYNHDSDVSISLFVIISANTYFN